MGVRKGRSKLGVTGAVESVMLAASYLRTQGLMLFGNRLTPPEHRAAFRYSIRSIPRRMGPRAVAENAARNRLATKSFLKPSRIDTVS
jgi:hypothetical protein